MINLLQGLPSTIVVGGRPFLIKTDFRQWLLFGELAKNIKALNYSDLTFLFEGAVPKEDFFAPLLEFYHSPSACPKPSVGEATIDYNIDGEYIFASILEQYGTDLVAVEHLHWHKFLAMVRGLSANTVMGQIMGYRGYKKTNVSYEEQMEKQKALWALPKAEDEELLDEINNEFYGA